MINCPNCDTLTTMDDICPGCSIIPRYWKKETMFKCPNCKAISVYGSESTACEYCGIIAKTWVLHKIPIEARLKPIPPEAQSE